MPAPEPLQDRDPQSSLGHVNLMVDTLIANANADDLRAITRSLLATSPPSVASQFRKIAQGRLKQINAAQFPASLCLFGQSRHMTTSTPALTGVLNRARSLYGAGMGFASLKLLTEIVRRTIGLRWEKDDEVTNALAVVDSDITQAIQSCKEEMIRNKGSDMSEARDILNELRLSIRESWTDVQRWGGEFPFDKSSSSLEYWKV